MINSSNNSKHSPLLGCIADDFTGATDLATNLVQGGMRVIQLLGVPSSDVCFEDVDAVVVALKTRSIPPADAVDQSLNALRFLQQAGVQRFYFKYCSTFDSTAAGNIGPVAEALMQALEVPQTIFCPAFPQAGRTVYQGHLFVGDKLLHESGMQDHPVNPMTDASLLRVLSAQATQQTGLLSATAYSQGPRFVSQQLRQLADDGSKLVVTDAIDDAHLMTLAAAVSELRLLTGGSALARYLAGPYRDAGLLSEQQHSVTVRKPTGRSLIIAGSCSRATNAQVAWMKSRGPIWEVDVASVLANASAELAKVINWSAATETQKPLVIASSALPEVVAECQKEFGAANVATAVEGFLADVAEALIEKLDVGQLILAGGETSGAIVHRLGITALKIGPEICTGVPWTEAANRSKPLALALKSGNFGTEDFFESALEMLA